MTVIIIIIALLFLIPLVWFTMDRLLDIRYNNKLIKCLANINTDVIEDTNDLKTLNYLHIICMRKERLDSLDTLHLIELSQKYCEISNVYYYTNELLKCK